LRHGNTPVLLPAEKFAGVTSKELEAIGHHGAFIDAVLDGDQSQLLSPLDYAAPMTEFILLGNIAMQHSPNWLEWDAKKAVITNHKDANRHIHRTYRSGWNIMEA
jgi:hypothetical protein